MSTTSTQPQIPLLAVAWLIVGAVLIVAGPPLGLAVLGIEFDPSPTARTVTVLAFGIFIPLSVLAVVRRRYGIYPTGVWDIALLWLLAVVLAISSMVQLASSVL